MSIVKRIVAEIEAQKGIAEAAQQSSDSIEELEKQITAQAFAKVGVSAFMADRAAELKADHFEAQAIHNDDSRAVASVHFVATQNEAFEDKGYSFGVVNEWMFHVRGFGSDVRWECSHRTRNADKISGHFDIAELSIDRLNELFELSMRHAVTKEGEAKAVNARLYGSR